MIGLILAAGRGSRLGDKTDDLPKSLLPLHGDKTILDYNILMLKSLDVDEIIIVTGYNSNKIEEHVKGQGIRIIYNPFWDKCNVLGSLYMALSHINDTFIFVHADTLLEEPIWKQLIAHPGKVVLPIHVKNCGEEEMKVMLDKDGRLVKINKSMKPELALGEFVGIAKFEQSFINFMLDTSKKLFITGALNQYMEEIIQMAIDDHYNVELLQFEDAKFVEIDFAEDYAQAKNMFSEELNTLNKYFQP